MKQLNLKTPITWYGGKQMMLSHILPIIPEHKTYVEPFFGGGAVFFSKQPVKCEIINDLNKEAINFYKVASVKFSALYKEVSTTLHCHSSFQDAKVVYSNPHLFTDVKRAWSFYTMANQSYSAGFSTFAFDRVGTTSLKVHNKRLSFNEQIKERLENVTVECDDALKVITRYDNPEAFLYVDPPYFNSDCGHYGGYSQKDFTVLLELLATVKGKFLLSSYPSEILTAISKEHGWYSQRHEKTIAVTNKTSRKKIEVLTANYRI